VQITLDYGMSFDLPYLDKSFDRVVASMLFHHLSPEDKILTLKEVYRILKTEGELHIADFGRPHNALMKLPSYIMRHLEQTSDLMNGVLRNMLLNVGFEQVEETAKFMTVFGTFILYRATKPK
jgi:SAM-dependent methyltransferase